MNILRRSLLGRCLALFLLILSFLIIRTDPAFALSVNSLGDYDNIAVMEVSGDYAAIDENGDVNLLPRQEVSREYYNHHTDDYDFLVIFTNFDFPMPSAGTKAFFLPTKNDIEGIGLELYDGTNLYSADGSFLNRLQGLVDMANIDSHVLEPTDPDFDKTLLTLTHEVLHRWGAYLTFMEDGQESDALLGLGNAHWSFLVDSQGSSLYGNHWQDNGDGTFTSVAPEQSQSGSYLGRVFSPLELYLMGLYEQQQVPPLTLIDSPGIDRNRLPEVGVTIPGSATTVTMEQIVSAMGERVPAAEADKTFRIAFLLLVNPDTWSAADPESVRQLRLIRNLQIEWEKRFSILTKGTALLQTDLVKLEELETNPGVVPVTPGTHVAPHVNEGINWLLINQQGDGSWQDQQGSAQRDTATAVVALKPFSVGAAGVASGQFWLSDIIAENSDFLSRKLIGLDNVSLIEIENLQNNDGGWGSAPGYRSNPVDSALVLKALTNHGSTNTTVVNDAIAYLYAVQGIDGGWNSGLGSSMAQPTAYVLLALNDYRDNSSHTLEPAIADGMAWLADRQNGDGGFGNSSSTVYDTAAALSVLKATGSAQASADGAINYLLNTQSSTGSWHNSAFQTAVAIQAFYAGTIQTDLQVETTDLSVDPFPVVSMPSDITLTAMIWNHGEASVAPVKVALYQGEPSLGAVVGEVEVSIPGHSFTSVDFPVHIATSADLEYFVSVDPDDLVEEVSNNNNIASRAFHAGIQPTVGFNLASSSGPESQTSVLVNVSLSHMWDQTVSVDLGINSSSTATAGADYHLAPGSLIFNPGETLKTVSVNIVNDAIPESDESLILTLSNPTNAALSQAQTSYTILNDDVPPEVGFAISSGSGSEDVGPVTIPVMLSHAYPLDIRVNYTIDEAASEATSGDDVVLTAGSLLIPAGETSATIDMVIINDTLEESDELLVIKLSDSQEALLGIDRFTYTILDDDAAPQVVITSPVNNETYTSGLITLQYQTNMPEEQVAVYLNDVPVTTRNGKSLAIQGNGIYEIRVVAANVNNVTAEYVVNFEVDDTGQPPTFVWQDLLQGELAGGKKYTCLQYSEDGAVYAVKNLELEPPMVQKFDQNKYLHWSHPVPEETAYNYCKDSVMTKDAYVILDAASIRWFSDASIASGVLSHNVELPVYDGSSWSKFTMDSADNYYLVGSTDEGISKNNSTDGANIQLVKMDVVHNVLWRQVIATDFTDTVTDIVTDSDSNIYLFGTTGGYLGRSGGSSTGGTDIFLIKMDSDGNELWSRQWGTSLDESSSQLAVDSQANVVLLGTTYGTFDGIGPSYEHDAFVIKVAQDGTDLWLSQDHNISSGQVLSLSQEDDVVIAGWSGRKRSGYNVNLSVKWSRYAAEGGLLWNSSISTGYSSYNDSVVGLVIDPSGNLFVSASYLYENYSTNRWESRGFLAKYKTGMDYSLPLLTVGPSAYDPVNRSLNLSGRHESLTSLLVQVDTSATVSTSASRYSIAWSSTISDLYPGQHRITIKATDDDGFVSQKEIVLDIVASSPFVPGVTAQYGTVNQDVPLSSAISDQDQVYFTGYEGTSDSLYKDVTIWQADTNGIMKTFAKIDLEAYEEGKRVVLDSKGFVYMAWDSGNNSYVGKFDSTGNQLWASEYSSRKGSQNVEGLAVDLFGNVFIAGDTTVSTDRNVEHGGGRDYFLAKFSSNGAYQWSRLSGPGHPGDQVAYGLDVDSAGHVYLAGFSQGALHGEPSANSPFVAKFDNDGNLQWVDVLEANRIGTIKDLVIDQSDNVYVLGEVDYLTGQGKDILLAKYDPAGVMSWFETFGGNLDDYARDISLDNNDHVLITCLMTRSPYMNVFKSDILWAQYDPSSHLMWVERFDADTSDDSVGIHVNSQGNILLAGRTRKTLGETSYGLYDLFVREFRLLSGPELTVDPVVTPTASQTVTLSGQVNQGSEISIAIDEPANSTVTVGPVSLNQVTGLWSCQLMNLVPNRDNVLTVLASDSYGSSSQSLIITVDTIPPNLHIDDVPSTTDLPKLLLSGTMYGGRSLTIEINSPTTPEDIVEMNSLWSYTADLVVGDNIITFTATDGVGNVAVHSVTITRLPPPPPSISVSPETLQQNEQSDVTLTINNPDGVGSSVYVAMLYDVTGDGLSVDDISVRKFHIYDGVSSSDPNVPGDEDGVANGRLTTTLNFHYIYDVQKTPGEYIFKVSFTGTPETASLIMTETSQAQTIQGYVFDDVSNPITSARVQLFDKWKHSYGYAYTDLVGHYVFNVSSPGEYYLIPTSRQHAFEKANIQSQVLGFGQHLNVDLSMVPASVSVGGLLMDSETSNIITSGNYVRVENDQYIAEAYDLSHDETNTFEYICEVPPGDYDFYVDTFSSRGGYAQGYLSYEGVMAHTTSGANISLEKATGLVCGHVAGPSMMSVAGVIIVARSEDSAGQFATAVTDANGGYCIGLTHSGAWQISINDKANQATGYVGNYLDGVTTATGPFSGNDLTVYSIDAWVSGLVLDDGSQPVAGVPVELTNTTTGALVRGETAFDGTYRLGAFAGDWRVEVFPEDFGYAPVNPVPVSLTISQTATQNFTVSTQLEPPFVDVSVQSPTGQSSQTISGNRSANAEVAVVVDTGASVGSVVPLTPTTWECTIINLQEGVNTMSVSASNGVDVYQAPDLYIDYQPVQQVNTITITGALYTSRKSTLVVEATSDFPDAALVIEYSGTSVPMNFEKLFKGKYRWSYTDTNVATVPSTVTVSGPEGSVTEPVTVK